MAHEARSRETGISLRAALIGFALIAVVSVAAFYLVLVHFTANAFGTGVPATAPFAALFFLGALMTVRPIRRCLRLRRRELLAIHSMLLMGAPLVSQSILGWMLPHSVIQFYLARAIPEWQQGFLPLVPSWFAPTDPSVVERFFVGQSPVPWSAWWTPLAAWTSFLFALVVASLCLTSLVHRQWNADERLPFPLAQVPLETITESADGAERGTARLPLEWGFWLGLGASSVISVYGFIGTWFPALPSLPIGPVTLVPWQKVGPAAGLGDFDMVLWPWLIALAYLLPKEVSFSCWFFWWVRVGLTVVAIAAGATPQRPDDWYGNTFPAPYWQGVGAVLALAVWTAWTARRHLLGALRIAFSRQSGKVDAGEPIPYRWAMIGTALSLCWLVYLCWLAGSRAVVGLAMVGLILAFYLIWARLRAETGMGFLSFPLKVNDVMLGAVGSAAYRPREVIMILSARWSYFPGYGQSPEIFAGNALESMKVADAAGIRQRPLLAAMLASFVFALALGVYIMMTGIYRYGFHEGLRAGTSQDWWLDNQLREDGARIYTALSDPTGFDPAATAAMGGGAAFTILLGLMRLRFWWWPFHPIGYLASNTWGMKWNWMPFLVGWLAKTLTIRYGGLRFYRRMIPVAVGLIGGDLLGQVVWAIIAAIRQSGG